MATKELVLSLRTAFDGAGLDKASRSLDAIKIATGQVDGALAGLDSTALKAARSAAEMALAEDRVAKSTQEATKAVVAIMAAHQAAASATAGDAAAADAYNRAVRESSGVIATLQRDTEALARLKLKDIVASEQQAAAAQKAADAQATAAAKAVAAADKQAAASERAAAAAKRAADAPKGGGGGGSFGGGSVFNALYSPPVILTGAALYGGFKAGQSYSQLQTDTAAAVSTSTSSQADLAYYKTAIPALAKQLGGRFTSDQLAQALFPIVSNGLSGKAAINALGSVADFSYAGGLSQKTAIDPATAASALAIGYTAYGKTLTPSQIANIDFSTIQAGGAAASDVVTQSGKYLGVAANAGVSAVDASGVFAALSRTLTPDISGLYTKDLIQNLTTPTKTQLVAAKAGGIELGPDAFSAANGGLAGQLDRIRRDVAGLSTADRGAYLTQLGGSAIGGQTLGALIGTGGAYQNYLQARGAITDKGAIRSAENIIDSSPQAQLDKSFKTLSDDITLKLGKDIDNLTPAAVKAITALDNLGNVTYDKVFGGFGNALDDAVKKLHILVDHPETGTSGVIGAGARDAVAAALGTVTGGHSSDFGNWIAGIGLPGGNTVGGALSATGAAADKAVAGLPGTYNYAAQPPSASAQAATAASRASANQAGAIAAGTNGDDPRVVYAPRNPITGGSFIPGLGAPNISGPTQTVDAQATAEAAAALDRSAPGRHLYAHQIASAAQTAADQAAANAQSVQDVKDYLHGTTPTTKIGTEQNNAPSRSGDEILGPNYGAQAQRASQRAADNASGFALAQLTGDSAAAKRYGVALIQDEQASKDSASTKKLLIAQINAEIAAVASSAQATVASGAARKASAALQGIGISQTRADTSLSIAQYYGDVAGELKAIDQQRKLALAAAKISDNLKDPSGKTFAADQAGINATYGLQSNGITAGAAQQRASEALRGASITYSIDQGNNAPLSVLNRDSAALRTRADAARRRADVGANAYLLPNDLRQNAADQQGRDRGNSLAQAQQAGQAQINAAQLQLQAAQFGLGNASATKAAADVLYRATLAFDKTITNPADRANADKAAGLARAGTDRSVDVAAANARIQADRDKIANDQLRGLPTTADQNKLTADETRLKGLTGQTALQIANEALQNLPRATPRLAPSFAPGTLDPGIEAGRGSAQFRTGVYSRDSSAQQIALLTQQVSYLQQQLLTANQLLATDRQIANNTAGMRADARNNSNRGGGSTGPKRGF